MSNENEKLLKVKKSCKAVIIVARILMIILIVCTVVSLIAGGKIWSMGSDFDAAFDQLEANGVITTGDSFGSATVFHLDKFNADNIQTSVPAIREKLDTCPQSFIYSVNLFMAAGICAISALVMVLVIFTFKAATFAALSFLRFATQTDTSVETVCLLSAYSVPRIS